MNMSGQNAPARRVRMLAATYIKGVVAPVGTDVTLSAADAAQFVSNGRAVYAEAQHNDVQLPAAAQADAVTVGVPQSKTKYA